MALHAWGSQSSLNERWRLHRPIALQLSSNITHTSRSARYKLSNQSGSQSPHFDEGFTPLGFRSIICWNVVGKPRQSQSDTSLFSWSRPAIVDQCHGATLQRHIAIMATFYDEPMRLRRGIYSERFGFCISQIYEYACKATEMNGRSGLFRALKLNIY